MHAHTHTITHTHLHVLVHTETLLLILYINCYDYYLNSIWLYLLRLINYQGLSRVLEQEERRISPSLKVQE